MEKQLLNLLQKKLNRAAKGRTRPIMFSPEEVESTMITVNDLIERVAALEKENTSLSLFGFQRESI